MTRSRIWIALAFLAGIAVPLAAQDQPPPGLKKTADGFAHEASASQLGVPMGWEVLPPQTLGRVAFLGLRKPADGIEVTASWSPIGMVKFDEVAARELELLGMLYKDKVKKADDAPMAGGRAGVKLLLDDGPNMNGKEAGVVYLFPAGAEDKGLWKVKVRATVPKLTEKEALAEVEKLVQKLKF